MKKTKKSLKHNGKTYRVVYTFNHFHGTISSHRLSLFYFLKFNTSKRTVELSNGLGSFRAYLNPRQALILGMLDYRNEIAEKQSKLKRLESLLTKTRSR